MTPDQWTLSELSDQVAEALPAKAAARADGRVREVPDARTIRWYQTTGLVDRPGMRGRTAVYGPRHLLQILAIKRLQAQGEPLASIQAALAGASDAALAEIVDPASSTARTDTAAGADTMPRADVHLPRRSSGRIRFWSGLAHPRPTGGPTGDESAADATPAAVAGLRLDDGVLVVLDGVSRSPDPVEEAVLREAAQPLLETLRRLDLLPGSDLRQGGSAADQSSAVTERPSSSSKEPA